MAENRPAPPPSARRSGWKRLARWLVALFALFLIAGGVLFLALRSPEVRQSLMRTLSETTESAIGTAFSAEDFRLDLRAGRLEVWKIHAWASGAEQKPFLHLPHLLVELRLRSLLGDHWQIRRLELDRPALDLGAPLPIFADDEPEQPATRTFELGALQVADARVIGDPAPLPVDGWLQSWRLDGVDLGGTFLDQRLRLELPRGQLIAGRRDAEALEIALVAALEGPLAGPWEVETLQASGDGLDLDASGTFGGPASETASGTSFDFTLEADAARLLPELASAGRLDARGHLDPLRLTGAVEARAEDFPAEILEPWLGEGGLDRYGLRDTRLDLEADLRVLPENADEVVGSAILEWRRGQRRLVELRAETAGSRFRQGGDFDLSAMQADLDLRAEGINAEMLEPWVERDLLRRAGASGTRIDLTADLRLEASAPLPLTGSADLRWRRENEPYLELKAQSVEVRRPGAMAWRFDAELLPTLDGERRLAGVWRAADWRQPAASSLERTLFTLDQPDIAALVEALRQRWPALVPAEGDVVELAGALDGRVELSGAIADPRAEAEVRWQLADGETVDLTASGRPVRLDGEAVADVTGFSLARLAPFLPSPDLSPPEEPDAGATTLEAPVDLAALAGQLTGHLELSGRPEAYTAKLDATAVDLSYRAADPAAEPLQIENFTLDLALSADRGATSGDLDASATDLRYGEDLKVDRLQVTATSDGDALRLAKLEAVAGESRLAGTGEVQLERPIRDGRLDLVLDEPFLGVDRARVDARLAAGTLQVDVTEIESPTGSGSLSASIPLGALGAVPALAETLVGLPLDLDDGPIELEIDVPVLELAELLALLEVEGHPQNLRAALDGQLSFGLDDLSAASGRLTVPYFNLATDQHSLDLGEPLQIEVGQHRLLAQPFTLWADGQRFEVERATAELRPFSLDDDPAQLVESVDLIASGTLPATLLQPYLGGGVAEGVLQAELRASGPPERLDAAARVRGPQARLSFRSPYLTRIESPEVDLVFQDGDIAFRNGRATLNQGELTFSGSYGEAGLSLDAALEKVRYRLNYGLSVVASGDFDLSLQPESGGKLGGRLVLERGILRRDLFLDREVLSQLLAPTAAGIPEESLLDDIALELELATEEGIRVRNNLADLRATWSPIRVRGTLTRPVIVGTIEILPGGYVYAFGQTVRLDEASLTFPGDPSLEPELEVVMTTSLDDPSIARAGANRFPVNLPSSPGETEATSSNTLQRGVTTYYGDQLAGQLGGLFGNATKLSFGRPILIFSEADPSRRLTVVRDLSNYISLAASVNLAAEGEQTYVLDLHDFPRLPRLIGQVFTTDDADQGAALQQIVELGGGSGSEDLTRPVIDELRITAPEKIDRRALRSALELEEGDRWVDGADFDLEIDATEHLRRRGYPEAVVSVRSGPKADNEIDVELSVQPGPKVEFDFSGDKPPGKFRAQITTLYRLGFYQETTIEEMRREWTRQMRSEGYVEPEVEITVEDLADGGQRVRLHGEGGRRIDPSAPRFKGVDDDIEEALQERFLGTLERVQLARGEPAAERLVLDSLQILGYPEARITGRELGENGKDLSLEIALAERQTFSEIEVLGVDPETAERLRGVLEIKTGDPARRDRMARAALALENDLRSRGHADARVRARLGDDPGPDKRLIFEAEEGPRLTLRDVRFTGQKATRSGWLERIAGLEKGSYLNDREIGRARRRLFETRVFRSVVPETVRGDDGHTEVVFDVEEAARYSFAYGLRWKSSEGVGAVFDSFDRNGFGRGVTLGLRALYQSNDQSLRLYSAIPKIFGTIATLEMYIQGREFMEIDDLGDEIRTSEIESSLQLAVPLTERLKSRVYVRFNDRLVTTPDPFFPDETFSIRRSNPVLGTQLLYDSRDDLLNATRGWFASADLSGSGEFLQSDFFYVRFYGQVQHFRKLATWRGRPLTWAQAWRVGLADAFRGQDLITEERFLAGGEYSIRGYGTDSIGRSGVLNGGEALFVLNQELRFPVSERFRGVLFYDAGNVWDASLEIDGGLLSATGLGVRASTPVGTLRLDIAFPLDRREEDESAEFYFGFGNVF